MVLGLKLHPERFGTAAQQPFGPDVPTSLHQEDPVSPGAANPPLEVLRHQQGVKLQRATTHFEPCV